MFEELAGKADTQFSPPGIVSHPASAIDETAVAQVQTDLRRRILRAFVGRGLLGSCDAKEMLAYQHSGFSVDASVCIEAHDRAALERLLHKRALPWCTAVPSSAASLALTSVAPRSTNCISRR